MTAKVITKPPFIYLTFLILGIVLQIAWPVKLISVQYSGYILIILGVIMIITCIRKFHKAGTTHKIHKPTIKLVTSGLFQFSRNPIYVALNLVYLGIGILADNIWILILIVPILVVMHYGVILKEEQYLEKKFGDEYIQYKSRVRRWI